MPSLYALIIDDSGTLSMDKINQQLEIFKQECNKDGSLYVYRLATMPRFFLRGYNLSQGLYIPHLFVKETFNVRVFDIIEHCLNDIKSVRRLSDENIVVYIISPLIDNGNSSTNYDGFMEKIGKLNQMPDMKVFILPNENVSLLPNSNVHQLCDFDYVFMSKMVNLYEHDSERVFTKSEQHEMIIDYFKKKLI